MLVEPFSILDSKKEKEVISTLRKSYLNKIVLIITHRHENIKETDNVFYL